MLLFTSIIYARPDDTVGRVISIDLVNSLRSVVVAGGVAANQRFRKLMADQLEVEFGIRAFFPPLNLCGDNGAMIAWAGAERLALGLTDPIDTGPRARWPLDPDAPPALGAGVKA